jgi:hypothetical protein
LRNAAANLTNRRLKTEQVLPIGLSMDVLQHWLIGACLALFAIAVVVAWWEQLGRRADPPPGDLGSASRAPTVDVNLDAFEAETPTPTTVAAARRIALGETLDRMAQGRARERRSWIETAPMIGPGPPVMPKHDLGERQDEPSPSMY